MIYVPDLENYRCVYVRGEGVIRAYRQQPTYNSVVDYRDYYIDSHYTYTDGQQSFSTYSTLPTCLVSNDLTNEVYYRHDFNDILVMFICLCLIFFYIPLKILFRLFRRFN